MTPVLIYDIEILKAIHGRGEEHETGIEYCKGWNDHAGMGISVIGALQYDADEQWPPVPRPRVFLKDGFAAFEAEADRSFVVGFNSRRFDDKVLAANGLLVNTSYDLLQAVWESQGLDPDRFYWKTHGGFGLNDMAEANGIGSKTGHGAKAPVDWQKARYGHVIDYCLADVWLTYGLWLRAHQNEGVLVNPKRRDETMTLPEPTHGEGWGL